MQRPPVPGSVTLGRVLLIVESVLWLLSAIAIAGVGVWFLSAGGDIVNRLHQLGYSGANVLSTTAAVIGGTVLAFAVVILVISIIGIWAGAAIGRLTTGPRVTGIVLASLGLLIGIVAALGSARTTVHTAGTFRGTPIPGIIIVVVNLLIIWALGFSGKTRAAFRSLPPPAYAGMAPAGYGPPPAYGQPGAADAFPPPPPPPPPADASGGAPYDYPPPPPAP